MKWVVQIQLSLEDLSDLAISTMSTPGMSSAFKNESFYTAVAGKKKRLKWLLVENREEKEDSLLTYRKHGEIILVGLKTLKTE